MRKFKTLMCFVLVFWLRTAVSAQLEGNAEDPTIRAVVDQYMEHLLGPLIPGKRRPGAIVGISIRGKRYFYHYGEARDDGTPFRPDTLVEIGSCTKVFTTTLFALAINRDQISPSESAQKHMPKGYTLRPLAQQVTPVMLADFSSGMPDDPTNLPPSLPQRSIEHYTVKDFLKWVSAWQPKTTPPAPYLYSNSGIGLLSYLVDNAVGKPWEEQLNREIVGPLEMSDTAMRPSPEQRQRLAKGHHANGTDAPEWPIFAWYAAGALRSTAIDMLRFGEANLGHKEVEGRPVSEELIAAMNLAQTPIYNLPNGETKQAMAWVENTGSAPDGGGQTATHPELVKNGGTVGFSSAIMINHFKDTAVFIAVNWAGHNPAPTAIDIGRHLP